MSQAVTQQLRTSGAYANKPLDERATVATFEQLQTNFPGAYVGLHIYVEDRQTEYVVTKLDGTDIDMEYGLVTLEEFVNSNSNSVLYTEQTLNNSQKARARENIGAGTSNFSGSYNDLTNKPDIPDVSNKVDKIAGKGLSTNDYDNTEKEKVDNAIQIPDATENDKIPVMRNGNIKWEAKPSNGQDGAEGPRGLPGHNPCLGRLNAVPADFDTAFPDAIAGDYVYVDIYDSTTQTTTTTIYHYVNDTNGWDNGTVIDADHPTLASGQSVTTVHIKDENGDDDPNAHGVLSAEAGSALYQQIFDVKNLDLEEDATKADHSYIVYSDGHVQNSSSATSICRYIIELNNYMQSKKITAKVACDTNIAAIAFYSGEIGTETYLSSASVPGAGINEVVTFEALIPDEAKYVVLSNRYDKIPEPTVKILCKKLITSENFEAFKTEINNRLINTESLSPIPLNTRNVYMDPSTGKRTQSDSYKSFDVEVTKGTFVIYHKGVNTGDGVVLLSWNKANDLESSDFSSDVFYVPLLKSIHYVNEYTYLCNFDGRLTVTTLATDTNCYVNLLNLKELSLADMGETYCNITNAYSEFYDKKFIAYAANTRGNITSTTKNIGVYVYPTEGIKKIKVLSSSGDAGNLAIAFYSSDVISNETLINDGWVRALADGGFGLRQCYEVDVPNGAVVFAITHSRVSGVEFPVVICDSPFYATNQMLSRLSPEDKSLIENTKTQANIAANPLRNKFFYAHLFIDKTGQTVPTNDIIIPSESLWDIRVSKRLGFNVIEGNVQYTSDNKFVVIHGSGGKFGYEVTDLNGEFTYADTLINSVTLDWIKTNLIYRSKYAKYRTAIPTLEEFLYECKTHGMIPFITTSNLNVVRIANSIMGKDNYIAYNAIRQNTSAPITAYLGLTTKADILAKCEEYGTPFIYCMSNPNSFTDEELKDIVNTLHQNGYLISTAYLDPQKYVRCRRLGFDFCAANWEVNEFDESDVVNINSDNDTDYSEFTKNNCSVSDGVLTLTQGTAPRSSITFSGAENDSDFFLKAAELEIVFSGKLEIKFGRYSESEYVSYNTHVSDGTSTLKLSSYIIDGGSSNLIITAWHDSGESKIYYLNYKVKSC